MIDIRHGDSREVLKSLADGSIDSVVTDPPYALVSIGKRFGAENAAPAKAGKSGAYARASAGFMGKRWDTGETAFAVEFWAEVYRVLKPGGHVIAFSGTRTYHRLACAVEDAGFEIRDMVAWLYGSGFPKSHDVSKGIDKAAGAVREVVGHDAGKAAQQTAKAATSAYGDFAGNAGDITAPATDAARQWQGWGTALKPALEPVVLARKPLESTVAGNVLKHGTGALNIDASRIASEPVAAHRNTARNDVYGKFNEAYQPGDAGTVMNDRGRWPANVIHDGSEEVVGAFPESNIGGGPKAAQVTEGSVWGIGGERSSTPGGATFGDSDSAARFFYTAKADATERLGTKHPTVKPTDLMAYLIRLVTPPGGTVLDPFAGSGSTGVACVFEGFDAVLIEREAEYVADIERRIAWAKGEGRLTATEIRRPKPVAMDGHLFPEIGL